MDTSIECAAEGLVQAAAHRPSSRRLSDLTLFGCKSLDDDQISLSNSLNRPTIRLIR